MQEFYLLLNDQTEEFSTFLDSMSTCFQIILGTFNAEIFEPTNGGTALRPIFFVAYNVCVLFVMVNLMVSILVEYYQKARDNSQSQLDEEDPDLFLYLRECLRDLFWFWPKKIEPKKEDFVYFEVMDSYLLFFIKLIHTKANRYTCKRKIGKIKLT